MNDKKDGAGEKIILFIIGVLIGAVVSTSAFLISVNALNSTKTTDTQSSQSRQGGTPPEMPGGQSNQNGQPPEKPENN